jgi:hypothetical protein
MKKIIFFLSVIAISFSCNEKKQETPKNSDLNADNLKGKVEQTTTTDYQVDSTGKMGAQDSCCVETMKYDEKGYITDYISSDKSGANVNKQTYAHYDNGAMKEVKISKNGKQTGIISIKIDKDGKYSGAQEFDSANKLQYYYTDFKENDYGGLTGLKQYKTDSTINSSMSSTFDNAVRTGNESMDSSGKVVYSNQLTLGDKKNVIEAQNKTFTKDSTINKVIKYKYDSMDQQGNWTQRTETDETGKPAKITKREISYYKK